jgi:phosphatidylserine/phosphatidylglycerophosphate/cardiolipin synthase-like enzyme
MNAVDALPAPWQVERVDQIELLVDADIYYASFYRAALEARRHTYLAGWQFDSLARLLRPAPDEELAHPIELLPFLDHLCERTPGLEVFILAWDYSLFYALEREWLQRLKFEFQSHARVHFEFSNHPGMGGCLHQKYALIDQRVAFVGGLDICDSRWDTRAHRAQDPARLDVHANPYKAFHDLQVALRGPVVKSLGRMFRESWERARSEALSAPDSTPSVRLPSAHPQPELAPAEPAAGQDPRHRDRLDLRSLSGGRGLALSATRVGLSRTDMISARAPAAFQVQALFERAILAAERLIYIETQYFTSRAIAEAMCRRFAESKRGKLDVVLVMPDGADTPKEDLVLGARQRAVRHRVAREAERHGHRFRLLKSLQDPAPGATQPVRRPATFIHSKLLIVDDELLSVGSANLTNRSMSLDTELNVTCATVLEEPQAAQRLRGEIAAIRANLLAEHAGCADSSRFLSGESLLAEIDRACAEAHGKLRRQEIPEPESGNDLLSQLFDPARPLDWESLELSLTGAQQWLPP